MVSAPFLLMSVSISVLQRENKPYVYIRGNQPWQISSAESKDRKQNKTKPLIMLISHLKRPCITDGSFIHIFCIHAIFDNILSSAALVPKTSAPNLKTTRGHILGTGHLTVKIPAPVPTFLSTAVAWHSTLRISFWLKLQYLIKCKSFLNGNYSNCLLNI